MIDHRIKPGETFTEIVQRYTKMRLDYSDAIGALYVDACRVEGSSILPNILKPGDRLTIPSKYEFKLIKARADA